MKELKNLLESFEDQLKEATNQMNEAKKQNNEKDYNYYFGTVEALDRIILQTRLNIKALEQER